MCIWSFHVKFWLKITPKNLVLETCSILVLSINMSKLLVTGLVLVAKIMKFVFLIFSDNLFNLNQYDILVSSLLTLAIRLFKFVSLINRLVSSANIIMLNSLETLTMSLIYKMNKRGPRMDPWGTPHLIFK
jgi:hypothetical protein